MAEKIFPRPQAIIPSWIPQIPEGQAIGHAETRREAIEADLGSTIARDAIQHPEDYQPEPENPIVIDVVARDPDAPEKP